MMDAAIAAGVAEEEGLEWKREVPAQGALRDSDLVQDLAAFANGEAESSFSVWPSRIVARQRLAAWMPGWCLDRDLERG